MYDQKRRSKTCIILKLKRPQNFNDDKPEYDPSNVDLWRQKQEKLNSILELTKKKLDEQKNLFD